VSVSAPATILPGEELPFDITLGNIGRGPALQMSWTNTDPAGMETTTALQALLLGASQELEAIYVVPADACPEDLTNEVLIHYEDVVGVPSTSFGMATSTVLDIVPPVITLNGPTNPTLECGQRVKKGTGPIIGEEVQRDPLVGRRKRGLSPFLSLCLTRL